MKKPVERFQTGWGDQHGHRFIALGHQYVRRDVMWKHSIYRRFALNGHLYKTDNSVKRTPRVGYCLSLLPLFDSLLRRTLLLNVY